MYSFWPEPEPAEREALILAFEQFLEGQAREPSAYRSEWRRAALEECAWDEDDDQSGC